MLCCQLIVNCMLPSQAIRCRRIFTNHGFCFVQLATAAATPSKLLHGRHQEDIAALTKDSLLALLAAAFRHDIESFKVGLVFAICSGKSACTDHSKYTSACSVVVA